MTAKTDDGNEVYSESKTYMPIPQRLGRGETMGRAPYEKAGLIEEASLPVHGTVTERFDFDLPEEEDPPPTAMAGLDPRTVEVAVRLFYLPFGKMDASPFLWREVVRKIPAADGN